MLIHTALARSLDYETAPLAVNAQPQLRHGNASVLPSLAGLAFHLILLPPASRRRFSPTLLVLNTFGLQLLMALCVGLLPVVVTSGLQAAGSPATVVIQRASATIESPGRTSDRTGITGVHTHLLDSLDSKPQAPLGDQPPPGVRAFSTAPALRPSQFRQLVHVGLVTQLCLRAMVSLIVVLCASVLHGHILVWAIIAPRFVFEICMAATAAAAALIVGLIIS